MQSWKRSRASETCVRRTSARAFVVCRRSTSWTGTCKRERAARPGSRAITKEDTIPETALEIEDLEIEREIVNIDFEIGDNVVYPHHGAGCVIKKEEKNILGEVREYLTIKILHNDMTVMVPCQNAGKAGLRRVIDEETVKKVLAVLADDVSEMPKNWNRRFKHNRDKIKTGDIYELAEVVRNLAVREQDKGLSTGEKQMYTRAKKILASEMMYALEKSEDEAEAYLDEILLRTAEELAAASASSAAAE
jgi:CarD family transcriptional regulator